MLQPREDLPLPLETAPRELGIEADLHQLDRDSHLKRVFADSLVDRAHPAVSDQPHDAIRPEPLPDPLSGVVHHRRRGALHDAREPAVVP